MNVWLVSPAWRRFAVTRLSLAQRAHLRVALAARGIVVDGVIVADDANLDLALEYGFHALERDNTYLGRKFNDGLEYALDHGADVVVLMGSDDWIHPDAFDVLPRAEVPEPDWNTITEPVVWRPGSPEIVAGRTITIVDLVAGAMTRCLSRSPHGAIPWLIHRAALEPSGGRPIREHQQRGTDFALLQGLGVRATFVEPATPDHARVDFKSSTNLNPYNQTIALLADGPAITDPWAELERFYPAELVELARDTHLELSAVAA